MRDWTKTTYGTPKSWDEIQQDKRDAEHDHAIKHGPGEPLAPLMWKLVFFGAVFVISLFSVVYLLFR